MTSLHGVAVQYPGCRQRRQLRQGRRRAASTLWPGQLQDMAATIPDMWACATRGRAPPAAEHTHGSSERHPWLRHIARSTAAVLDAHAATARTCRSGPGACSRTMANLHSVTSLPTIGWQRIGGIARMHRLADAPGKHCAPDPTTMPRCRASSALGRSHVMAVMNRCCAADASIRVDP